MTTPSDKESRSEKLRQYGLAAVLIAMVVYFGGEWVWEHAIQGPIDAAQQKTDKLQRAIQQREKAMAQARANARLLDKWASQSLPSDPEVARSLYQAWLMELVGDVEFVNPSVSSTQGSGRKGLYNIFNFSLRARGSLDQLRKFLFAFYETDLLHQIRSLNITPIARSQLLDLSITIEALALTAKSGATDAGKSPETVFEQFRQRTWRISDRLASKSLKAYAPIVQRNLFSAGQGETDPTDFAYLTSITMTDGQPEVWFNLRATNETVRLREGDTLEIGPLTFTIALVRGTDVILEADGERWLLTLGDKLTDAFALPPEY